MSAYFSTEPASTTVEEMVLMDMAPIALALVLEVEFVIHEVAVVEVCSKKRANEKLGVWVRNQRAKV